MTAPLILFAEYSDLDPQPARSLIENSGLRIELLERDADGRVVETQRDAVGMIAGYSQIDAHLMDQLAQLRIIAASSNGTNMIDTDAARERNIWVTNLGSAATQEVAAHALTLALAAVRELPEMTRVVTAGGWADELAERGAVPRRISELTLGLVGFGRIGAEFARIAAPVFGRVIAHDPYSVPAESAAESRSFDEVLAEADVVSLHLPLTSETHEIIGADAIARMRDRAVLINVSRGELVDLDACLAALDSGKLASIGFDVLNGEPPAADHPLRTHPRAIVTPHSAYLSDAALRHYETDPARYIVEWRQHGAPSASVVVAARQGAAAVTQDIA